MRFRYTRFEGADRHGKRADLFFSRSVFWRIDALNGHFARLAVYDVGGGVPVWCAVFFWFVVIESERSPGLYYWEGGDFFLYAEVFNFTLNCIRHCAAMRAKNACFINHGSGAFVIAPVNDVFIGSLGSAPADRSIFELLGINKFSRWMLIFISVDWKLCSTARWILIFIGNRKIFFFCIIRSI